MNFRIFTFLICSFFTSFHLSAQKDRLVKIEYNKVLGVFSFMEAATKDLSSPPKLSEFIEEHLGSNDDFQKIVEEYSTIQLRYHMKREEYPESRDTYAGSKDFLWIASCNASDLDDFNERIIGYLPHSAQQKLIHCLRQAEPYYERLIWNKEQDNLKHIEQKLSLYKEEIQNLFLSISSFYGTDWKLDLPFKIMLYPIPARKGGTTAIPKGNNLICSFLSLNPDEYKSILGIAIHEMCHILYDAQPIALQEDIERWFNQNKSNYNNVSYSYLNEGLATVLGNGWAYREIHKTIDTSQWYNNTYINGYAHALFSETDRYMKMGKTIDQAYVDNAILTFENEFPNATNDVNVLLSAAEIFADWEDEYAAQGFMDTLFQYFNSVRSLNFSVPIMGENSIESLENKNTKLILLSKNKKANIAFLNTHLDNRIPEIDQARDWIHIIEKPKSSTMVILLHLLDISRIGDAYTTLKKLSILKPGTTYFIDNQ